MPSLDERLAAYGSALDHVAAPVTIDSLRGADDDSEILLDAAEPPSIRSTQKDRPVAVLTLLACVGLLLSVGVIAKVRSSNDLGSQVGTGAGSELTVHGTVVTWCTSLPCGGGDWVRYHGFAAAPGISVPEAAWVQDPGNPGAGMRVFDAPNGKEIGYAYMALGYVPLSMAPTFDWSAASIQTWGCDIRTATCTPSARPNVGPDQTFPGG